MSALPKVTIGLDVGDRMSVYAVLDGRGRVTARGKVPTDRAGLTAWARALPPARVVLEVSTHSAWISRLLTDLEHTPIVANARKVKAVSAAVRKSDTVDAETLARLGRVDPVLLAPVTHRGVEAQVDLAQLRSRDALVRCRTLLINHVRGTLKSLGYRAPTDLTSHTFAAKVAPVVGEHPNSRRREHPNSRTAALTVP